MSDETRPWYETLFERDWYDYFAKGGPGYPDTDGSYAHQTDGEVAFIERALGADEPCDLLDLCCGPGRHSVRLAKRGHRVTGVDISAYNLEKAAERAPEFGVEVTWREADMRATGLADSSQDVVINMFTALRLLRRRGRTSESWRRSPGSCGPEDGSSSTWSTATRSCAASRPRDRGRAPTTAARDRGARLRLSDGHTQHHDGRSSFRADGERMYPADLHTVRIYTLQELDVRMAQAGLTVEEAWGGLRRLGADHGQPPAGGAGAGGVAASLRPRSRSGRRSAGALEALLLLPLLDLGVVAAEEDLGDGPAAVVGGAGVLGVLEQTVRERLLPGGGVVAEGAGEVAGDGLDEDHRGELAARQDVVADRDLAVDAMFDEALVDAFVTAGDKDEAGVGGEVAHERRRSAARPGGRGR